MFRVNQQPVMFTSTNSLRFSGQDKDLLNRVKREIKAQAKTEKKSRKNAKQVAKEELKQQKRAEKLDPQVHKQKLARKARRRVWVKDYAILNGTAALPLVGISLLVGNPLPMLGLIAINTFKFALVDLAVHDNKRISTVDRANTAENVVLDNYDRLRQEIEVEKTEKILSES